MTLAPIRSAAHAASYFERGDHADYYLTDDVCPSEWVGQGADLLGVKGQEVEPERFKRYLNGDVAGQSIGTERNGSWQHKPGWDLQFSPSKSVSVAALVGGDQRIIDAHDNAVKEAICLLEKKAALTRLHIRDERGRDHCEQVFTGNLLAAVFRHDTSRALDPQLHSHAVVLNATQRVDGNWRSLESRHFYSLQKEVGVAYRQSLSASLRELGYSLERSADGNFEIEGIPKKLLNAYSKRRDVVDRKLADLGYTRETASLVLKEKIAHESRYSKERVERKKLLENWRDLSRKHEFDSKKFVSCAMDKSSSTEWQVDSKIQLRDKLELIVNQAIDSLSERDAVFSQSDLESELNRLAVGYGIPDKQVHVGIEWAEEQGILIGGRSTKSYSSQFQCWQEVEAYTTPNNVLLEEKMVKAMLAGKSDFKPEFNRYEIERILALAEQDSKTKGFEGWTAGQKTAVRGVLSTHDQFTAVQGYAGTAKTSTALRIIGAEYEKRGYTVTGMAPSASACESLSEGADIDSVVTVASHLLKPLVKNCRQEKQLWLVDEASLLSTKDTSRLLEKARFQGAKVVLVGDIKQLGSVEAGAAFRQLQDNGIAIYELDEIVRQENESVLNAVHHSLEGDAESALEVLAEGGGRVIEFHGDAASRHKQIVDQYISLTEEQRVQTLVIDPSREGRDHLNEYIRKELKTSGEIADEEVKTQRLERVDFTKAATQDTLNYQVEDVIRFSRAYKSKQVDKNSYWSVKSVDSSKGVIELTGSDGKTIVWNPLVWGAKSQVFRLAECSLSIGDKLTWLVNDKELGVANGSKAVVKQIDVKRRTAEVEFASGRKSTICLNDHKFQHWNYDYVTTVHASQGKTCERVILHAESYRRNLASQKALYVAISRAKQEVIIYTDNKERLIKQISEHTGEKQNTLENDHVQSRYQDYDFDLT